MNEPEDTRYLKLGSTGRVVNGSTGETHVDTDKNKLYATTELSGKQKQAAFDQGTRRYLDDLRMPHQESRPYAIVAAYALFGLTNDDIAFVLRSTPERIQEYKDSKEYNHILDCILQNVREHDKDKVRKILNAAAEDAASTIRDIAKDKTHSKRFAAAQDILNRTGHGDGKDAGDTGKQSGILIQIIDDREKKTSIDVSDL